ncbi:MAG: sugar isomerase, partial [Acutalibacteraceae bacterium]
MGKGKRATYNFMFGIFAQVLTVVLGVVVPRLVLTSYGSEVNGLINTVTQVYSYIGLLEAGVGLATVQALYKTIGDNDRNATNRVLAATNSFYHKTGIAYLAAIAVFSLVFPFIVSTEVPTVTVILIIVFNGLGNVINYFFQGKYLLFLQAEGKTYIQTGITMATNIFRNVAKIVLMSIGMDVVFVQAISMVVSLIQMIYITLYIKRNYKWLDLSAEPDFDSISQSKNVLVHQISSLIFNNTDMIILSAVCGLKMTSVYSMYAMLFGMIGTFLTTIASSVTFALGQIFNSDKKRYIKLHDCFEVYYMAIVFGLYSVANFFIIPFLKLYTSGV